MKARDIETHMRKVATWVDWTSTVDTFKAGDPEVEVRGIAVTWIAGREEIRAAQERGCNVIVCHEPVYYVHRVDNPEESRKTFPQVDEKLREIKEAGVTIFRCHDVWDRMPDVGIPWSWAKFLGLKGPASAMNETQTQHVYTVAPVPFRVLAQRVAAAVKALGEEAVQVIGDPDRVVSRVGVGTGCICSPVVCAALGADVGVVCDDGTSYWAVGQWAHDFGFPLIRVNHGTSEEPGMVSLAAYLRRLFPQVPVQHIPQGCRFRLVEGT